MAKSRQEKGVKKEAESGVRDGRGVEREGNRRGQEDTEAES